MERKMASARERALYWPTLAAVLALVTVVALSYVEWRKYHRANSEVLETRAITHSVDRLLSDVLDAETGQRGYLLTGDDTYLNPYNRAIQSIPVELARLKRMLAARPNESSNVVRLDDLTTRKLAELDQTILLRRTRGPAPALAIVLGHEGRRTMDEIRAVCADIQRRETASQTQESLADEAAAGTALLITVSALLAL